MFGVISATYSHIQNTTSSISSPDTNINICLQLMEDFLIGANGAPAQCHAVVERVNECAPALRSMAKTIARDPRRWLKHATPKTVPPLVRIFKWVLHVRLTQAHSWLSLIVKCSSFCSAMILDLKLYACECKLFIYFRMFSVLNQGPVVQNPN